MDVERYADDVFLNHVGFLEMRGAGLEIVRVSNEHVAFAAGGTVELNDDGAVDLGAAAKLARQLQTGARKPLPLQLAAGFPIEYRFVAEVGHGHLLVLFERKVCDER